MQNGADPGGLSLTQRKTRKSCLEPCFLFRHGRNGWWHGHGPDGHGAATDGPLWRNSVTQCQPPTGVSLMILFDQGQPMGQGMGGMGQMGMGQPMGQMQMGMGQPMGQMQQPMGGCMGGQMGMGMGGGCMGMDGMGGQMGMGGMGMGGGMGGMGMGMGGGMDGGLQTGTVKSWNDEKGFGFIIPFPGSIHLRCTRGRDRKPQACSPHPISAPRNGGGDDIFVHRSALTDGGMLLQGAQVQFEVTWNAQKGSLARIVVLTDAGRGSSNMLRNTNLNKPDRPQA